MLKEIYNLFSTVQHSTHIASNNNISMPVDTIMI